ncbi:hypothetical protein J2Z35_000347 [Acetoanaerobium pronyense]|uniref:Uncharacterized protein n=1 Tax=Acetoanaerobium pronyense TaxID=1482736 RepID=A0ABS4KFN4_9FIRM|nr:hypothetical protein [Acetoanaerobium pronyense]MBP2026558.1 hypothetical protein [Acetoanaerobium pronyense]
MEDFNEILGIENPTPYENLKSFDIFPYTDEVDFKDSLGRLDVVLLSASEEFFIKGIKHKFLGVFHSTKEIVDEENFKKTIKDFIVEEFMEYLDFEFRDIDIYINMERGA